MTTQLKGGKTTEDPRLDWVYPGVDAHFPSLNYLSRETVDFSKPPRSYTWSVGVNLDQGNEGACVGFGFAHELAARPQVVSVTNEFARANIYWPAQRRDYWAGGAYPGATPFYEGTSVLAGAQVVTEELGYYDSYLWSLDLRDIVYTLGYKGPIVAGTDWYSGMDNWNRYYYVTPTGSVRGGHCYLLYRVKIVFLVDKPRAWENVDMHRSWVGIWNSWGVQWGKIGMVKMRLTEFSKLITGGEFCNPQRRKEAA